MLSRTLSLVLSAAVLSHAPAAVAAPPRPEVNPSTAPQEDVGAQPSSAARERRNRNLRVSGLTLLGTGALLTAVGVTGFASIHATNPGQGLEIEGEDPAQAKDTLRTVRIMSSLGYAGLALMVTGGVLFAVGDTDRRAARRSERARKRRLVIAPGPGAVLISARF
jgi:hypothetical protein